jgi:ATP/ADP translocase
VPSRTRALEPRGLLTTADRPKPAAILLTVSLLRDAVPLRRGEWGLALFLYFLLTVMVGADWVGKLGADALFVKRYGVQNVPWMYIITPIAMLVVSALIFFFIDRMRRRTMLLVYVFAVTLLSVGIQYAITTDAIGNVVQPISYVFAHGVKETIYILFWVYAGNLYDAEQSKRLFPFFAGSVLVGKILGGVIGAAIAPALHAENFIGGLLRVLCRARSLSRPPGGPRE